MSAHKIRHIHAVIATITIALEYDPQDLAALTTLNAQIREAARVLPGYTDIAVRLGKIPAPAVKEPVVVAPAKDDAAADLSIPTFLQGSAKAR